MGRRRTDSIDLACREWARERRRILGLDDFTTAREMIGALRSTLGQRRDLHAGATSTGRVEQHFPEVYVGEALEVHRAYRAMRPELKDVLDVHYVARAPADLKAEALAMSPKAYWTRVSVAKSYIEGWLAR
jgi:hypothetical protein